MQPDSPYQLIEALGSSQIGSVWAAVDPEGRSLTVAVLDAGVATDQQWRASFAAAANALAQPDSDGPRPLYADFSATTPWVVFAADGTQGESGAQRIFLALGVDYHPVPPDMYDAVLPPPQAQQPWQAGPPATQPVPASPYPVSASPYPVSGVPQSPAVGALPSSGHLPVPYFPPSGARRRRTGLLVGAALVVLVAAGTAIVWQVSSGSPPAAAPTGSPAPAAVRSAAPLRPGLEPPLPGSWPAGWPKFNAADHPQPLNLAGVGFKVTIPSTWDCVPAADAGGAARYHCGATLNDNKGKIGGELIVRDCPKPCDERQRTTMRRAEEAWGLRWRNGGAYATLAETLKLNGERRYGMVLVGYWRSVPGGTLDRQVVLRMTAPVEWVDEIRRVANAVRDTVVL